MTQAKNRFQEIHNTQRVVWSGIVNSNARFFWLNCGRRWGKTEMFCEFLFRSFVYRLKYGEEFSALYIAPSHSQAVRLMWKPLIKRFNESGVIHRVTANITDKTISTDIQGIQLHGYEAMDRVRGEGYHLVLADEVASYKPKDAGETSVIETLKQVVFPTLVDKKGILIGASTPRGSNDWKTLYEMEKTDSDHKSFHFTTFDNPTLPKSELERLKKDKSIWAQQEYYARFVENADERSLIPLQWILEAQERDTPEIVETDDNQEYIGLDPAGMGEDTARFIWRKGRVMRQLSKHKKTNPMELAGIALNYLKEYPEALLHVDAIGIGEGIVPRLKEFPEGERAVAIKVSHAPTGEANKKKFLNQRAQGWWALHDWLMPIEEGGMGGKIDDSEEWNEAAKPRYKINSTGKIQIESKEDLKKRGVKSTDLADAAIVTMIDNEGLWFEPFFG